jgi:hypothetical protein
LRIVRVAAFAEGDVVVSPSIVDPDPCRSFSTNSPGDGERDSRALASIGQARVQLRAAFAPFLLSRVRFAAMILPFMRREYFARVIGASSRTTAVYVCTYVAAVCNKYHAWR